MAVKASSKDAASIDSLTPLNRYFVLRSGTQSYYMKNISLSADHKTLEATLDTHYEGKNVLLEKKHIEELEKTFTEVNHSPVYKDYPTLLYHGYHQRRVGCFSGSRSVYVDSAGDVHACPFCHTKSYNIIELVRNNEKHLPKKENTCPQFKKIA